MTRRTVRVYVGLGANIGDAADTLARAVTALGALPGVRLRGVSRLYATTPVGVTDQAEFRNAVVALDIPAAHSDEDGAMQLLVALKSIERSFGRGPGRRWGPRELDLDLLVYGRARLATQRSAAARSLDADADPARAARLLEVPHRDAGTRLFVLAPLADLAPGLVPPGWGRSVETARRRQVALEGADAVRPVATWNAEQRNWRPISPGSGSRAASR